MKNDDLALLELLGSNRANKLIKRQNDENIGLILGIEIVLDLKRSLLRYFLQITATPNPLIRE